MGFKKPSGKYFKFTVYLILIILVNLACVTIFFRTDLTKNSIYSLSDASKQVVSTLSEPLTINVFFTKNLPAPYNNIERYLHDLLEEYRLYANNYFNYRFYNVSVDSAGHTNSNASENQQLAENYGIYPVQIQAIEEDEVKFIRAYMGLVLIHGDIIEKISTITSTDGFEYQLTTAIQKLNNKISALLNLSGKIKVTLFFSSSLKKIAPYLGLNDLPDIPQKVQEIVRRLDSKNYGKFEYQYLDPSTDISLSEKVKKYNILNLSWPAIDKANIPAGQGTVGLVMEHGEKGITIPLVHVVKIPIFGTQYSMTEFDELGEVIDGNLASLIDIHEDIGILQGNGTLGISGIPAGPTPDDIQGQAENIRTLIEQNYTIKNVNLENRIPGSIKCLVIPGPTQEFSDYELFQIDQFLMQGKNIALFLDAYNEVNQPSNQGMFGQNPGPEYIPVNTGLEKLLAHYGVHVKKSYVMDKNCYEQQLPQQFGGGLQRLYFAPMIKNEFINNNLKFMKNIKGLIALKISPLALDNNRISENRLNAHKLFASSEQSWEMTGQINLNPMFIRPPDSDEDMKSMPLAYLIEGEFPSYFAGKSIPEKILKSEEENSQEHDPKEKPLQELSEIKDKGTLITKGKPGKIFIMASSAMLTDSIIGKEGRSPVEIFMMNLFDLMNNREDIAAMRGKKQSFNPLSDTGHGVKTFVKSFNIAGLPLLVVCFGLLVWSLRSSRKKRIQTMFAK
jgi:ABC-2 type transport system permease protein